MITLVDKFKNLDFILGTSRRDRYEYRSLRVDALQCTESQPHRSFDDSECHTRR